MREASACSADLEQLTQPAIGTELAIA